MSRITISPPGGAPSPTFDHPFEMLEACHERVHRMLALLAKLRAHVREHGADGPAREAARDVMRYFDLAAPEHHRDEELHVFPALQAAGDARLLAVVRRLQEDHRLMETGWAAARAVLAPLAAGELQGIGPEADRALASFAALYDGHIRAEEDIAYPAAQARLDDGATRQMGEEMRRRRGAL